MICCIYITPMLDDILSGRGPVVQGGPLQSIVAEAIGLGDRATITIDQSLKLLHIPVGRRCVHIVLQALHPKTTTSFAIFNPIYSADSRHRSHLLHHLDLRRHFPLKKVKIFVFFLGLSLACAGSFN
uniref:Palmitoyltransferase TIP1 n=1 Tax=Rhizophora mucronata TaxID=61149 RepID=A0A2P2M1L4_RHIMU